MSTVELAEILDLTPRRLQQLAAEGVIPGNNNGAGFEVRTAVPAYIRHLRSGLRTARNDALRIEQTRLARENADAQALENARTRGTLVEAESVYKFYVSVFVKIRQVILCSDLSDDEKADLLADLRRTAQRKKGERLYA
jgi:phage terminase Nu1 subunit (DNA packaging protein)